MTMNLSYMNNPFHHIYMKNQSEFLQNNYTTPINSTPTTQETNEINTTIKPIKIPKQNA